jgi:hypothetical protein
MFTAIYREDWEYLQGNPRLVFLSNMWVKQLMMNKYIVVLILCLIAAGNAFTQESIVVNGVVREKTAKEILSNVTVVINNNMTVSNEYGFFSLRTERGDVNVSASFFGYRKFTQTVHVEKDTTLIIELDEGIELDEVIIEAKQVSLKNKGLGNIQIDVSQLRNMPLFLGERDIIKAMQFLPGVSSGMEGSSNLNIRGGTNDQTLYLLDDVPVYNQNHTLGFLSIFNPEIIRSADLYKGGIPAMYGNRLSGVANIYLKNGNMTKHRQSVSAGPLALGLHLEGPVIKDKLSYSIAARHSLYDLIALGIIARIGHVGGSTIFSFYDVNAKLGWDISKKTNLSFQMYAGYDSMYGINMDEEEDDGEKVKYDERYGVGWKTMTSSVNLRSSINPNLYLVANLYCTTLENFTFYQQKLENSQDRIFQKNKTFDDLKELGLKTRFEHKINNSHNLFYGLEMSEKHFKPGYMERVIDKNTTVYETGMSGLKTLGFFVYDEITVKEWLLGVGLRGSVYNNPEKSRFAVEPRIKLNRMLGDENRIMFAYDYMTQPIHSINEMNYSIQKDFWIPFQENRLPYSRQFSAGWKNTSVSNLTLSVESYWKEMRNILRIDNLENYLDYHTDYVEGKGRSYGLEVMAQYDRQRLSAWLSYTLSKSTRTFENRTYPFKYDTPNNLSTFVSYDVYKKNAMRNALSINAQYHTGIPYFVSSTSYPDMGLPSYPSGSIYHNNSVSYIPKGPNTRLPDYFRADINFTMEKKLKNNGRWVWQLSFLNFTGHINPYTVYQNDKGDYKAFLLIPFMPSFSYTRYF